MKFKDGKIEIDMMELMKGMIDSQKEQIIESLACDCDVIKFVTQQIIDGFTENGFFGSSLCTASHAPTYGLDWAKREVAKASGEVAKREIEALEKALKNSNERYFDLANERAHGGLV